MSKILIAVAMLVASVQPAFANGLIQTDLAQLETAQQDADLNAEYGRGGKVIGGIIGGIIGGLIIADQLDRHPSRYRDVVCYAENYRGRTFRAYASRARIAQRRAMDKCYSVSRSCRPMGCEGRW